MMTCSGEGCRDVGNSSGVKNPLYKDFIQFALS